MKQIAKLMDLRGRVALVTGGCGHLGRKVCSALAELGADIVVADIEPDSCDVFCQELTELYGIKAISFCVDLADEAETRSAVQQLLKRVPAISILVNNAAYVGTTKIDGWATHFLEQNLSAWRAAMEVNVAAPFVLAQELNEALTRGPGGVIINISSIYGLLGPDWRLYEGTTMANPAAYAVSKGGLVQLTRWLATTLAPRVRVNCIAPGGILRNQPESFQRQYIQRTPLQRMGEESDIIGAVVYLATDMSAYVTGQTLVVDGGWSAW